MALTSELIDELDSQDESLQSAINELRETTQANNAEIIALRDKRETLLREATHSLLPDLSDRTLARLETVVPDFATGRQVAEALRETTTTYESQLAAARQEYDPVTFEARKMELEAALQLGRDSLHDVETPFKDLAENTAVEHLLSQRYGNPGYKPRWYGFLIGDRQYFRDWEQADLVVERAGVADWRAVEALYTSRKEAIQTFREQVATLSDQLQTLVHARSSCEELATALANVAETVRDRFRTKLLSRLEEIDPPPEPVRGIRRMEDQIKTLQDQSTRLHEARAKLAEQLVTVRGLRAKAARSRRRTVPDDFLDTVREARPVRADGSGPAVVYVQESPGWSGMDLYFAERLNERMRHDARERDWDAARHDRSGQS